MTKVLFVDVDGTLVGKFNAPPASAVRAIREARAKGHKVYICTGRSKAEVYDNIWDIGLDGMIGGNGCYIEDHGHIVMHQHVELEDVRKIVEFFKSRDIEFYLEANSGLYPSPNFKKRTLEKMGITEDELAQKAPGLKVFLDGLTETDDFDRNDVNKISYMLNSQEDLVATKEAFPYLKNGCWGGNPPSHGDVGVTGIDKKHSVNVLLDYLGVSKEDTIAFGDEPVDIPMFEAVNYGVAMGSGDDRLKAVADYVTTGTDDDGLYNAFKYLGLID